MTQDGASLIQRLQSVEAELAALKRSFSARTVQAQGFILTSASGRARGWFAVSENGTPEFKLAAADGTVRTEIVLDDSGAPRVVLFDENGKQRAAMQVADTGEPSAYLWDDSGVNMIALRTLSNGNCEVILNGGVKGRLRLATEPEGASRIELFGEDSEARAAIRSGVDRPAEVLFLDSSGDPRAELFLESNDATGLHLHDYLNNHRLSAVLDLAGKPEVVLLDTAESEVAALRPSESRKGDDFDEEDDLDAADLDADLEDDEDDDPSDLDDEDEAEPQSAVGSGMIVPLHSPQVSQRSSGDAAVASILYPTDLLDAWRTAMDHPPHKIQVFEHAFTFDNVLAIAALGVAREFSWQSNSLFGGSTNHVGVALFLVVVNRTEKDIKNLDLSKLVLVDDRGHQYSPNGAFYWAEEAGSFNRHASDIMGGARQEGFLLFPALKRGSTRYVRCVLRDSFWVEEDFGERKYELALK